MGPYLVIEKIKDVNYKIALETNLTKTQVIHINMLTKRKSRMEFPPSTSKQNTAAIDSSAAPVDSVRDIKLNQAAALAEGFSSDSKKIELADARK